MEESPISADSILQQLTAILSSPLFESAARSRALLKFVVEQTVANRVGQLKEYALGVEALGRGVSFDPRTDPIVRAEASRLRARLERYYAAEGVGDPIVIVLPKGSYVAQFVSRKVAAGRVTESAGPPVRTMPSRSLRLTWAVAAVLAAASGIGIGAVVWRRSVRVPEASMVQFDAELRFLGSISGYVAPAVALSPDGARLVFASIDPDGATRLNTRRLDQPQTSELPGTEGARAPFFSPDGRWVGFWASGKLKKLPVDGGSPVTLCDLSDVNGASWGEDGNIIAAMGSALLRIPASGGAPATLLDLTKETTRPAWPQVLPGGEAVLFTAIGFAGPDHATIEALSLATGKRSVLARGGTFGRYLPGSFLTYVNQGTLFAVAVDLAGIKPPGAAASVLEGVSYSSTFGYADLDFSRTGILAYRKNSGERVMVEWLDRSGKTEPLIARPGRYLWPRLSPDGKRVALSVTESGDTGVWIYDGQPGRFMRLPPVAGQYLSAWTPDGRYLILGGTGGLSWVAADSAGTPRRLTHASNIQVPWSFTPDGTRLAYHEMNESTGFDLWTVAIHESPDGLTAAAPEPFLQTPAFETYPTFSPDGRWIAYGSNESGGWEVCVRAFPDNGTVVQVSTAGGRIPHWSARGHELLYRTDDQRIMAASYAIQTGSFVVQSVRPWSPNRLADTGVLSNFDLSLDGRIVALMPAERYGDLQPENHITFMLNFQSEVRRRLGSQEQDARSLRQP
jgi:eukaryotic-like serine/threonine-protein kinase